MTKTQLEITLSLLEKDRKSLKQERDTYRDLCGELSSVLADTLPMLSAYIPKSHITEICLEVKAAITKAEAIMGENSNG